MNAVNADIIIVDLQNRVLIAGVVKSWELSQEYVEEYLDALRLTIPEAGYFMFADPLHIRIWKNTGAVHSVPDCVLDTAKMLVSYEPEYGKIQILHHSMVALIETWLWDHMYHWKHEIPPGADELKRIEMLPALADYSSFVPPRELREVPAGSNLDGGGH